VTGGAVSDYGAKLQGLARPWSGAGQEFRLAKSSISNLFRYQADAGGQRRGVDLSAFNQVIRVDPAQRILESEGLATFETVVDATLAQGLLPLVAPELKHITVGGATVGIGIESTGFRYGFVHDALLEADVLLPDGRIVSCTADNEFSDLFHALPNSYGTLGYILRARLQLYPAKPFVQTDIRRFDSPGPYLEAMLAATSRDDVDFVEGLFFQDKRFYLMLSRFLDHADAVDDILREHIYYQLVQQRERMTLRTRDYIFRYDPEWFWNIPLGRPYRLFRRYAPERFRNSGFYSRYAARKQKLLQRIPGRHESRVEPLIQDWEVPWDRALELTEFCLREVDLGWRPWAVVPIRPASSPTLYPVDPETLYFNLGSYCQVPRRPGMEPWHDSRIMDEKCFSLGGIKMLYSSTFLDEAEFDGRFNGAAYRALKAKYDPQGRAKTLYQKVSV
jgi:FAD/FMN-containing dehydrogenase